MKSLAHQKVSYTYGKKMEFRDYFLKTSYDAQVCTLADLFCFTI